MWRATKACSCSICSCCFSCTASCICWGETERGRQRNKTSLYWRMQLGDDFWQYPKRKSQTQSFSIDGDRYNTAIPWKSQQLSEYCCCYCCYWHWKEGVFCSGVATVLARSLWGIWTQSVWMAISSRQFCTLMWKKVHTVCDIRIILKILH